MTGSIASLIRAVWSAWMARQPAPIREVDDGPSEAMLNALRGSQRREAKRAALRCRVGDQAVIVKCRDMPRAVGMLVAVEARASDPSLDWLIRSMGSTFPFVTMGPNERVADIRDACLSPLRGADAAAVPVEEACAMTSSPAA